MLEGGRNIGNGFASEGKNWGDYYTGAWDTGNPQYSGRNSGQDDT